MTPEQPPRQPPPLDRRAPPRDRLETATLALGCFWGPDARFGALPGVVRTRVGYAGGEEPRPTYRALGDHVETVQVDFRPDRIGYRELLRLFWASHDPGRPAPKRQYLSAIFHDGPGQRRAAEASRERWRARSGVDPRTELIPLQRFWPAEAYHQKYRLRQHPPLLEAVRERCPTGRALVDSTVAARLNGLVAGHGTAGLLERELELYGLDDRPERYLRKVAGAAR